MTSWISLCFGPLSLTFAGLFNKLQYPHNKTQSNKMIDLINTLRWSPYTFCYLLHPLERHVTDYTAGGQFSSLYIMCWFSPQSRSWSNDFSYFSLLLDNITQALKAEEHLKWQWLPTRSSVCFYLCLWWLHINSVLNNLLAFTLWLQSRSVSIPNDLFLKTCRPVLLRRMCLTEKLSTLRCHFCWGVSHQSGLFNYGSTSTMMTLKS